MISRMAKEKAELELVIAQLEAEKDILSNKITVLEEKVNEIESKKTP